MYIKPITRGVSCASETNDCLVRSAANAAGISYCESYSVFRRHGRKKNRGCQHYVWKPAFTEMNFELIGTFGKSADAAVHTRLLNCTNLESMSLQKALKIYNKGSYVMMISAHAFAVVDGEFIDDVELPAKCRITTVFRFKGD